MAKGSVVNVSMLKASLKCLLLLVLLSSPAQASVEKVIYHLHGTDINSYRRTISNIENLQHGMPGQPLEIILLLQGSSIQILDPSNHYHELNQRFQKLRDNGVHVEVARENFRDNLSGLELNPPPRLIGNVFSRIIELQQQGYHYITP